jgi:hypothetical protein
VSLLERLGQGHLDDRQFARLWTTGGGDPHLDRCESCRERYDAFASWVSAIGDEIRDEADQAFTAEQLATQHAQVLRRLEAQDRPTRVIAFPKAARAVMSGSSHARRWVTVAAAAGLIAGIGLGQLVDLRRAVEHEPVVASHRSFTSSSAVQRASTIRPVSMSYNDEDFLTDAEAMGPRIKDLQALDDLTPHARDLVSKR